MLHIAFIPLLAGLVSSNKLPCCHSKMVGEVNYTLVTYMDTSEWGCKENCVYAAEDGGNVCFKTGELPVTCQESSGGGWPQEPQVESNYTARGEMVDLDPNMKGYLVGSGQKVVIWSTDIFGITGENSKRRRTKEWADFLAEEGDYTVLVPDWFRGNNMPFMSFDPMWVTQVTNWTRIESDWKNVVLPYLETKMTGPLSIGLIGTCWGSYPVVLLSRFDNIKCGISMHPSHDKLIPTVGQNETEVLSQVVAPQLFMTEGGVADSVKAGGIADEILGDKITFEEFNDMEHGWTVGGDLSDPDVVRDVEKAKKLALEFFAKYL